MSFCVYYDKDFEYTDEVQELRIVYRPKDRKNLQEFLANYSTKHRIIIEITKIKDVSFEELAMIKLKHPDFNFTLTIDETFTKELMSLLDDTGLPYYFINLGFPCQHRHSLSFPIITKRCLHTVDFYVHQHCHNTLLY